MNLPVLSARKLAQATTEDLWNSLTGHFFIQFDDGLMLCDEGTTNATSHSWRLHKQYPDMPLLKKHHFAYFLGWEKATAEEIAKYPSVQDYVDTELDDKKISVSMTTDLFHSVIWDVYDWVVYGIDPRDENQKSLVQPVSTARTDPLTFREELARHCWEILNEMYNELSIRCEPWVVGVDMCDLYEFVMYPTLNKLLATAEAMPIQPTIDTIYDEVDRLLFREPKLRHNKLSRLTRSKLMNDNQVKQCVGVRGFITDIDSRVFNKPILRNLVQGIRSSHDSQIESRSAAKSLAYSEEPLEQSEYFSRRQQIVSQTLQRLHEGDCGARTGISWLVEKEDLKHLDGKNYYDENGNLRFIRRKDKHLIGKTINMRSLFMCQHPDPFGVCSTCFGQLSFSVFKDSNLGQDTAVSMLSAVSQKVLSVKHLDGSSVVDAMVLSAAYRRYMRVGKDGSSYYLSPDLKNATKVELIFDPYTVPGFTDIKSCKSVNELFLSRISRMNSVSVRVTERGVQSVVAIQLGMEKRKASLSFDVVSLIRERGWTVEIDENAVRGDQRLYVVDITGLDHRTKLFTVPLRHFNMGDQAKAIADLLESNMDKIKERDEDISPTQFIAELFETVNSRLDVNFAVLEAITYSIMIVSAEKEDYSPPKPWTDRGLGVKSRIFRRRSASAEMAFEGQQEAIIDPTRYAYDNVPDHPMDVFIDPAAVVERFGYE